MKYLLITVLAVLILKEWVNDEYIRYMVFLKYLRKK
jgi:hypothetical protein